MQIFDRGRGISLVLLPGLQGRWEYLRPTLDALAEFFRVITVPMNGERGSGRPFVPSQGLDGLSEQVAAVLDDRDLRRAVICGISFGGLVALRFVVTHPERALALVLASTPGADWRPTGRHRMYARAPLLFGPLFLAETPQRLRAEMRAAIPRFRERQWFAMRQAWTLVVAPLSPSRMAARARLIGASDVGGACSRISVPTLVVTGEPSLDRIVPVESTADYMRRIPGARGFQLDRTGHIGCLTRPELFAAALRDFVSSAGAPNTMRRETPGPEGPPEALLGEPAGPLKVGLGQRLDLMEDLLGDWIG